MIGSLHFSFWFLASYFIICCIKRPLWAFNNWSIFRRSICKFIIRNIKNMAFVISAIFNWSGDIFPFFPSVKWSEIIRRCTPEINLKCFKRFFKAQYFQNFMKRNLQFSRNYCCFKTRPTNKKITAYFKKKKTSQGEPRILERFCK